MRLVINVKNKKLINKILDFLKSVENEGVEILKYDKEGNSLDNEKWDEEFIETHWREILMSIHSADRDDDEYLYEAAWEFL